jgi:putative FmdB family regulatory protein
VPTYQYACTECGHAFEQVQSFTDDALTVCPQCEGRLRKVFNAVGVVFKGSGFYRTDSRADSRAGANGSKGSKGSNESGGSDGSKSSDGSGSSGGSDPSRGSGGSSGKTSESSPSGSSTSSSSSSSSSKDSTSAA